MRFTIISLCLILIMMVTTYCVNAYNVVKTTKREIKMIELDIDPKHSPDQPVLKRSVDKNGIAVSKQVKENLTRRSFLERRKSGHAIHKRVTVVAPVSDLNYAGIVKSKY